MIKNSILIGLSFLISKVLGLLREMILASHFGIQAALASHNLDAYFAAFKLPDFVFTMVSSGVISSAFVPLFVEYLSKENKERARRFASDTLFALCFFILIISVIFFAGAPYFMKILVPGFSPDVFEVTVTLTRIMLVTPIIFTLSGIYSGINNSLNHFKGIALAPIFYNLGIILGILVWGDTYGVYGVAFGVIIGAVANLLVQLPEALTSGITLMAPRTLWNDHVKRLLGLALPRMLGMSITQISLIVDTFMASLLAAGSLTYMNLSSNLYFVPVGVVGISIAVTGFGHLSALALNEDKTDFIASIRQSLRTMLFLLIPMTVGMIMLSLPLVQVLFMRGSFTYENAVVTAGTVQILSFGILGMSLVQLLARCFYALKDTRTPLLYGFYSFIINCAIAATGAFYFHWNTYGLALGNAVSNTFYAVFLIIKLSGQLNKATLFEWRELAKYVIGGGVVAGACSLTLMLTQTHTVMLQLVIAVLASMVVYFIVMKLLKSTELSQWTRVAHLKLHSIMTKK